MTRILIFCMVLALLLPLLVGCSDNGSSNNRSNAIVFALQPPEGDMEIWMMDLDGSGKALLASRLDGSTLQGSLSPDGRTLLYLTNITAGTQMITQDLNTGELNMLLSSANGNDDMTPAYSPNGQQIAHSLSATRDIYVMDADGSDDTMIAGDDVDDYLSPAWNANGTRIVFAIGWDYASIWTMNPDGSDLQLVKADDESFAYRQPSFLPDGRILACRVDLTNSDQLDVVVMDDDGGNEINLTPGTLSTDEYFPSASSDGTRIAYAVQDDASTFRDIYVATFTGNSLINAVNLTDDTEDLCWRPKFGYVDPSYLNLPD